jgi:hypothetical protein
MLQELFKYFSRLFLFFFDFRHYGFSRIARCTSEFTHPVVYSCRMFGSVIWVLGQPISLYLPTHNTETENTQVGLAHSNSVRAHVSSAFSLSLSTNAAVLEVFAFCGTWKFITLFTRSSHWTITSELNPIRTLHVSLRVVFNIVPLHHLSSFW